MHNHRTRVAAILSLLVAFGGSWAAAAEPTGTPYDLHAIISLSGPGAFFGSNAGKTMKIVESAVNAAGGVHGRPLRIVLDDDQSSPQVAVQLTNGLIQQKAPIVLGPSSTASCAAADPLVVQNGPVQFCISPFIEPSPGGYVFSNGPTGFDAAVVVLRYLRLQGLKRIAVISTTDAPGTEEDKATTRAFALPENSGLSLVAHEQFAPNDISVAAQIAAIKASNPQALVLWNGGGPSLNTAIRAVHDASLDVPIVCNGVNMTIAQTKQLQGLLPKDYLFVVNPAWIQNAPVAKPVAAAQATLRDMFAKAGVQPDGGYISVYDMTMMVVDALKKLPPDPNAAQMRDYLLHLHDWVGVNAVYDFRDGSQRGIGQNGYLMARYEPATTTFIAASKPGGNPL